MQYLRRVIKEHNFLQDVKSREREQWARDFDKVIQHPRIVESMFVQKWWTQRFFAAETKTARNCKVTVCNQLLLLSSNAEIHVREALEWLFSTVNCHFIQTMLPDYLRSMSWFIWHCAVPRNKDDRNGMILRSWYPIISPSTIDLQSLSELSSRIDSNYLQDTWHHDLLPGLGSAQDSSFFLHLHRIRQNKQELPFIGPWPLASSGLGLVQETCSLNGLGHLDTRSIF